MLLVLVSNSPEDLTQPKDIGDTQEQKMANNSKKLSSTKNLDLILRYCLHITIVQFLINVVNHLIMCNSESYIILVDYERLSIGYFNHNT